jgi:2'-5' RNA ligase
VRLFVAVDLPAAEKLVIARELERLSAYDLPIRWLAPETLHITLKFLGEVTDTQRAAVVAALRDVVPGTPRFQLTLRTLGAFPSLGRPNVFWLGVGPSEELQQLQRRIDAACAALGFEGEQRGYKAHITLGKTKARERIRARALLDRMVASFHYKGELQVQQVQLMRSHTGPRGARYETLESVELN